MIEYPNYIKKFASVFSSNSNHFDYDFKCIISGLIITNPYRGKDCDHLECYEKEIIINEFKLNK